MATTPKQRRRGGALVATAMLSLCGGCNGIVGIEAATLRTDAGSADDASMGGGDSAPDDADAPDSGDGGGRDGAPTCTLPHKGPCTVFPQTGCAANQNCEITGGDGTSSCSSIGTNATPYSNCASFGMCPLGHECVGMACKPFCCATTDCAGANRTCEQILNNGFFIPGLRVCSAGCDPVNPSTKCGAGVACFPYPWDGAGRDHGDCAGGAGTAMGAGGCTQQTKSNCAPGYYCLMTGECAKWCRVGHNEDCASPRTCMGFSLVPTIGGVPYGVCL